MPLPLWELLSFCDLKGLEMNTELVGVPAALLVGLVARNPGIGEVVDHIPGQLVVLAHN